MKNLVLLRHAKSSWDTPSLDDFDRPLNKRGKKDAPAMARRLKALDICPDFFLSSPAKRAIKTARKIANGIDFPEEEIFENEMIYMASTSELMALISHIDDGYDCVFIVGHNPGLTHLANILGDEEILNIPTCGIYSIDFDVPTWKEVPDAQGRTLFFEYPKKKQDSSV